MVNRLQGDIITRDKEIYQFTKGNPTMTFYISTKHRDQKLLNWRGDLFLEDTAAPSQKCSHGIQNRTSEAVKDLKYTISHFNIFYMSLKNNIHLLKNPLNNYKLIM